MDSPGIGKCNSHLFPLVVGPVSTVWSVILAVVDAGNAVRGREHHRGGEGYAGRGMPLALWAPERWGRVGGSIRTMDRNEGGYMINGREERTRHSGSRLRLGAATTLGVLLVVGTVYAGAPESAVSDPAARSESELHAVGGVNDGPSAEAGRLHGAGARGTESPDIAALRSRVEQVTTGWAELADYYDAQVAPIARVLRQYRDDDVLTGRIAAAVVREARATNLEPRLLLGVLLVENPWLDTTAQSFVGAVGLMQVMPVHTGGWSCGSDLESIDTNICLGARVFAHNLDRTGGDVRQALLRYNGCVTGANTPDCGKYPSRVLARAGGPSVLAWAGQSSSAGSP